MTRPSSDIAFTSSVKAVQEERGSRAAYAQLERRGGFETEVDERLRAFLARIDTAFLATANGEGQPYIQHRGGPRGFIRALDAHTLAFVDFAGNRQYVSTGNLRENDKVCLFLIDYERPQRVKVWGTAKVVPASPELLARLGPLERGARAEQVILIHVSAWDVNCPRHIPQKLDASRVAESMATLEARIAGSIDTAEHGFDASVLPKSHPSHRLVPRRHTGDGQRMNERSPSSGGRTMVLTKVVYVTQFVSDQDKALEFYTSVLGFTKRADNPTPNGPRFLSVGFDGQDFQLVLWPGKPGQGQTIDGRIPATCTLETPDCRKAFETLKSRGVKFETGVLEYPWGYIAVFVDPDGNRLQLREAR